MKITLFFMFFSYSAFANTVETYSGEAKNKEGKTVYIEKHKVTFTPAGDVVSAKTQYEGTDGKLQGSLTSDFSKSLTAPAHTYTDARNGEIHGIRYKDDQIVLFLKEPGKDEKTKTINPNIAGKGIIVGCQGLHYYLRKNFDSVVSRKKLPIKMLIPGKLDYYSFNLEYQGEKDGLVEFEVEIDSFFLSLFAPSLTIKYDKKTKHLMQYEGLSNILDNDGEIQNVTIRYDYPSAKS